uniref:S41 family peptidase n=1 Tax=Halobacteriovorax sp. TaxID=2020862 RepID=UPI003AF2952E
VLYDRNNKKYILGDYLKTFEYDDDLYIKLQSFSYKEERNKELDVLYKDYSTVYIDLRGNTGGYLKNARAFLSRLFRVDIIDDSWFQYFYQDFKQLNHFYSSRIKKGKINSLKRNEDISKLFSTLGESEFGDINRYVGEQKIFKRKIVIFADSQCFSACIDVLYSILKHTNADISYHGEFKRHVTSTDITYFELPHSKIVLTLPLGRITPEDDVNDVIQERINKKIRDEYINARYIFTHIFYKYLRPYLFFKNLFNNLK